MPRLNRYMTDQAIAYDEDDLLQTIEPLDPQSHTWLDEIILDEIIPVHSDFTMTYVNYVDSLNL